MFSLSKLFKGLLESRLIEHVAKHVYESRKWNTDQDQALERLPNYHIRFDIVAYDAKYFTESLDSENAWL